MPAPLTDETAWAAGVGARLRMLQASFADDAADARRDYLAEELARAVQNIPQSRRRAYLEALADRFPAWGGEAASSAPATVAPREQTNFRAADDSPEDLVAKLAALAPRLSAEKRAEIARQLQGWGFAAQTEARPATVALEPAGEVPVELQKKLSMSPDAVLDRARVLKLIAALVDFVVTLDQLVWNVWKNVAPQSIVRRDASGDLRKLAGPYLTGDSEVSTAQITQALDKTRQLAAGLLAAVGATGEMFAKNYLVRFSPAAIKERADAESGFFLGPEQKCWRKYVELFGQISGMQIEQELSKIIADYAEGLILGASRPGAQNVASAQKQKP